ncbi:hypothetical protein DMUE_2940 [Dictyocoela muelleri]|nr:hypothetical protein DMUE_2940 [Dictyocoela muelleri]
MNSKISIIEALGSGYFSINNKDAYCYVNHIDNHNKQIEIKWYSNSLLHRKVYEDYYCHIIKTILDHFIVSETSFQIHIISHENSICCAINALLLALVDAGIQIKQLFYSITADGDDFYVFVNENNQFKEVFYHSFFKYKVKKIRHEDISLVAENMMHTLKVKTELE